MRWMGTRFEFKKLFTLLDLCVSSLRRGHANLLCIVPILTDDPRRESEYFTNSTYGGAARLTGMRHKDATASIANVCVDRPYMNSKEAHTAMRVQTNWDTFTYLR